MGCNNRIVRLFMNIKDALDKLSAQEFVYMIYNRSSFVPYVCCDTDDTMLDYACL